MCITLCERRACYSKRRTAMYFSHVYKATGKGSLLVGLVLLCSWKLSALGHIQDSMDRFENVILALIQDHCISL